MNSELELYARAKLKEGLEKCTAAQQLIFKRMYSHEDLNADIEDVVANMPSERLDWAMHQVSQTITRNSKDKDQTLSPNHPAYIPTIDG